MADNTQDVVIRVRAQDNGATATINRVDAAGRKLNQTFVDQNGHLRNAQGGFVGMGSAAEKGASSVGRLESSARSASSGIGGLNISLGQLAGMVGTGFLVKGAADMVSFGIKSSASLEQTTIGFETMLGSASEADSFIRDLQGFAAKTPFEFKGLASSAQQLLAFGFGAKDVLPMMTAIGDASAGLGRGGEGIDSMTRAIGQMQAKTRIQTEELMQLQELGVPALQILADGLHMTTVQAQAAVTAGAVQSSQGIPILLAGMEQKFGGLMDRQSKTLGGLYSTLKDNVSMALTSAAQPFASQLEDRLPDLTKRIVDFVTTTAPPLYMIADAMLSFGEEALPTVGPALVGFLGSLNDSLPKLLPVLTSLVEMTPKFVSALTDAVTLVTPISDLVGKLLGFGPVSTAITASVTALLAYKAISTIVAPVTAAATALYNLAAAEAAANGGVVTPGGMGAAAFGKMSPAMRAGVGVTGAGISAAAIATNRNSGPTWGGALTATGGAAATGAVVASAIPIPGVSTLAGGLIGGGLGLGSYLLTHHDSTPKPAAPPPASTVDNSTTTTNNAHTFVINESGDPAETAQQIADLLAEKDRRAP